MSESSLNLPPSPPLLAVAAQGAIRPRLDTARGTAAGPAGPGSAAPANPFGALLAGVLGGTQPTATGAPPVPTGEAFPEVASGTQAPDLAVPLALPGVAPALPAATAVTPDGNGLPASGNPLPVAGDPATAPGPAPPAPSSAATDATDEAATPAPAVRPRIFLADLALSKPVDPGSSPVTGPAVASGDGARQAGTYTLAGRSLLRAGHAASEAPVLTPVPAGFVAPAAAAGAPPATVAPGVLPGSDAWTRRLAGADPARIAVLPGAGTDVLAGQLAAFAAGTDTGTTASATASGLTGSGAADAGSAAPSGRFGSTGLPPLQPLGHAGAFAGGLADRLLTLGGPGAHSARLKLHPEQLGELDVEITMDDGTAQVWFGTTTPQARDAIEGSLPRLRELFAEQGIQLTRTQVDAGSGESGHAGFGQERRMDGGAGAWNDFPAWQPGRPGSTGADPAGGVAPGAPARLLDVWA